MNNPDQKDRSNIKEGTKKGKQNTLKQIEFLERVNKCVCENEPISERLACDLMMAKKEDLNWDIFYTILDIPQEAETGYWNAANVASTLLLPIIRTKFYYNKNDRINENAEEDFLSEVKIAIRDCIPNFDKSVSHFPNYVKLYIEHVGYVHNKDSSPYLQKKNGIRVFSQEAYKSDGDAYSQIKSEFRIEEEYEKKEKIRSSNVFSAFCINKKALGEDYLQNHKDALEAKAKREKLIHATNRIVKAVDKGENILVNEKEVTKHNIKNIVDSTQKNVEQYDQVISSDFNQTIINASFWHMFLGGFASFPENVKNSVYENINTEKEMEDV